MQSSTRASSGTHRFSRTALREEARGEARRGPRCFCSLYSSSGFVSSPPSTPRLSARASVWSECMSFLYAHNYFHLALLRLDRDEYDTVREILDQRVWPFDHDENKIEAAAATTTPTTKEGAGAATSSDLALGASFGTAITSTSFLRHDAEYPEDQNAALNLLWRLEIRATCIPASTSIGQQVVSSVESPSSSAAQSVPSPAYFASRWSSLTSRLTRPIGQPTSLFGLLQLVSLHRAGRTEEAAEAHALMQTQVEQMPPGDAKTKLAGEKEGAQAHIEHTRRWHCGASREACPSSHRAFCLFCAPSSPPMLPASRRHRHRHPAVLLPFAAAISAAHTDSDVARGSQRAFELLQPIMDAESLPSSSDAASSQLPASPPTPLSQAAHLSCLCASGEQLEVLTEWFLHVCVRAGQTVTIDRLLQAKTQSRRDRVHWYQRLEQSTRGGASA